MAENKEIKLYTTNKIAEILNVTPVTARRYIRSGEIKASRIGQRAWRVKYEDLQDYLNERANRQ